jgi:hypothetical protein
MDLLVVMLVVAALIGLGIILFPRCKPKPEPEPEPEPEPPSPPPPCPVPDSDDPEPLSCSSCYDDKLPRVYRHWMFEHNAACLSDPSLPQCKTLNNRFKNELRSGVLMTGTNTLYGDGIHRDCGCLNG